MSKSLPANWETSTLDEIANIIQGQSPPGSSYNDQGKGLPFFQGKAEFGELNPSIVKWCTLPKKVAYPDDILLSIRAPVGPTNLANVHCAIGRGLAAIRPMGAIPSKYILYYFRYSNTALIEQATGSTFKAISGKQLRAFTVFLPPLCEQHRIVAKIEQLFSELDKGVAELKKARETLSLYRQSLLKAAFEGRLTEKWRREHADELESADHLLALIKAEREKRYRQQVEDWKQAVKDWEAQGKPGRKPTKPRKPKELPPLTEEELASLPELPEGWLYTYLAYMGDLSRGKSKHRPRNDPKLFGGPYPFIQTGEVKANHIIDSYTATYNDYGLRQSKLWPKGTLCITIAANIAETAFLGIDACFPDSIVGFTNFGSVYNSKYVDFFIKAVREKIQEFAPATAQKNINLQILEKLIVPYCSSTEQKVIIHHLSQNEESIKRFIETIDSALEQSNFIRQSILKKAFTGKIVPQDPDDEPASELLKRIKVEREKADKEKKPNRKTPIKRGKRQMADLLTVLKHAGNWISAQEAFRQCGISDGAETDRIEALYLELRDLVNFGKVDVERRGEEDWLKLQATQEAQGAP